jgi:hypothetical protein
MLINLLLFSIFFLRKTFSLSVPSLRDQKILTSSRSTLFTNSLSSGFNNLGDDTLCSLECSDQLNESDVLSVISTKLYDNEDMDSQIAMLFSLKCVSNNYSDVRHFLSLFAIKIRNFNEDISSQKLCDSLFCLQCMSSDCFEVRSVLTALSTKINSHIEDFSSTNIADALYGLRCMSSDCSEVRGMLSALNVKVQSCSEDFSANNEYRALNGLRKMNSDCAEVRKILSALTVKIRSCNKEDVSNYGVSDDLNIYICIYIYLYIYIYICIFIYLQRCTFIHPLKYLCK